MIPETRVQQIENILKECLRGKFRNYHPEPASMPFHTRLLGSDRMALFSFVQSLNTSFGTAIFEPAALVLATDTFQSASKQQAAGDQISAQAQDVIQGIMNNLTTATLTPNKPQEIEAIRAVCRSGEMQKVKLTKVDIELIGHDGTIFLCDIKTAKPNKGGFKEHKRTLLEWVAAALAIYPEAKVQSLIAIPYNPYEPKPYERWTIRGMLDLENELKVGNEFWDFLGGDGAYLQLLAIFEKVGIELKEEIDAYFLRFKK